MKKEITCTQTTFEKKEGTKNAYMQIDKNISIVSEHQHKMETCPTTAKAFRRCGGSEYALYNYTPLGYKCTKVISKSPSRDYKIIREYKFNIID